MAEQEIAKPVDQDPLSQSPLNQLPRRVFDGFGLHNRGLSHFLVPRSADELSALFRRASELETTVCFRGNGRSYGDARSTLAA